MTVNLLDIIDDSNTDEKCRELLEDLRWPDGVTCPKCGCASISELKKRPVFDCNDCRYQFSVTAGTIMHDSHLPLRNVVHRDLSDVRKSKKGISANQLSRTIGVAYRTAWYLCHRIREKLWATIRSKDPTLFGVVRDRRNADRRQDAGQRDAPTRATRHGSQAPSSAVAEYA